MLDIKELKKMAKVLATADKNAPVCYSNDGVNLSYRQIEETFRKELNELAGNAKDYRANKNLIFELVEEVIDEYLPATMKIAYDQFAEVKTFGNNEQVLFRRKLTNSRLRAKQFVTRAGLAGHYEVFKLANRGEETFEVRTSAVAAAAQIGIEEFMDGRVDFAELTQIVLDGMNELVFEEIGECLKEGIEQLPAAQRVASNGFTEALFDELLIKAEAFGTPQIYCTYEMAVKMVPQEAWKYTEAMKDELNRTGRLASYKGRNIIVIPQGFKDETLTTKVIDPGFIWVVPSGANFKPVKVALQGPTMLKEIDNLDWSKDIQAYKKVGVSCIMDNNVFCYVDTSLQGKMTSWNLEHTVANVVETKAAA